MIRVISSCMQICWPTPLVDVTSISRPFQWLYVNRNFRDCDKSNWSMFLGWGYLPMISLDSLHGSWPKLHHFLCTTTSLKCSTAAITVNFWLKDWTWQNKETTQLQCVGLCVMHLLVVLQSLKTSKNPNNSVLQRLSGSNLKVGLQGINMSIPRVKTKTSLNTICDTCVCFHT